MMHPFCGAEIRHVIVRLSSGGEVNFECVCVCVLQI